MSKSSKTYRNLGDLGEFTLGQWCSQVGITPNPVQKDKTGWDGLLEFPLFHDLSFNPHVPLDRGLDPLRCFVQVKSTDKRPGKWKVKLSNLSLFALNPYPAFLLVFEFELYRLDL